MPQKKLYLHPEEAIMLNIHFIRGQKVLLDRDLAKLYGVAVNRLNESAKRNRERFPEDFMFHLTEDEYMSMISNHLFQGKASEEGGLESEFATSKIVAPESKLLKSQIITTNKGRGGAKTLPYAFTEQGIVMISSILNSSTAIIINIHIIRIFVKMRAILPTHQELQQIIERIEQPLGTTNKSA